MISTYSIVLFLTSLYCNDNIKMNNTVYYITTVYIEFEIKNVVNYMKGELKLNVEVRYISRSGNTKKIADAIGKELGVKPLEAIIPLKKNTTILFLGSALYALQLDNEMINFIENTCFDKVDKIYCFSTTSLIQSSYSALSKALAKKGVKPEKLEFHCRGKFGALYSTRPNKQDIKKAAIFARTAVKL